MRFLLKMFLVFIFCNKMNLESGELLGKPNQFFNLVKVIQNNCLKTYSESFVLVAS